MKTDNYIIFDKYLAQELTNSELKSFENKLKLDTNFKQEFEIYKALETSLSSKFKNEAEEIALRKTLSNLGSKYINSKDSSTKKKGTLISMINYKQLMVAASIALLVGLFLFNNGNPVYSDFSNHNSLELVVRGENNDMAAKAEKAFNSKNYKEALDYLILLPNQNDTEVKLYKGISYLELNNYVEADIIFDEISSGNSAFKNTAMWYKALSMLKQKQFEACKYVLQTIPESADEYKQAKKLLRKL
ncbi:tetratricopeptide repeat protein [Lutibacter sp.]